MFKIFPNTKSILTQLPNNFNILPEWKDFTKSGHTEPQLQDLTIRKRNAYTRGTLQQMELKVDIGPIVKQIIIIIIVIYV